MHKHVYICTQLFVILKEKSLDFCRHLRKLLPNLNSETKDPYKICFSWALSPKRMILNVAKYLNLRSNLKIFKCVILRVHDFMSKQFFFFFMLDDKLRI